VTEVTLGRWEEEALLGREERGIAAYPATSV
jgi:hypothetical protein